MEIPIDEALGRVTAQETHAPEDLPSFPRSTMDGYSLRAADTFGASEGLPAYFKIVGEVPMGRQSEVSVDTGEAALAYTGGMLAGGADAVIMVENTQQVDAGTIDVTRPVAVGENVVQPGEDVKRGDVILPAGHYLRPQDLGGMTAMGITNVSVAAKPRVAILSLGDEVVSPKTPPSKGQIRDINTYTIAALVEQAGGIPLPLGIVRDDYEEQTAAAIRGLEMADVLVFSAGSSVSSRDMTAQIIGNLGQPGVLVHGLAIRPGKPTVIGLINGKPAFGLPGNPVSAMVVFDLVVRPTLYHLAGCANPPEPPTVHATLAQDIASTSGREDFVPVRLTEDQGKRIAHPVFGKSNLIFTLIRSDGLVHVPLDRGGLYAGEDVPVRLY
jgi:molybdopterin molybdotransferase